MNRKAIAWAINAAINRSPDKLLLIALASEAEDNSHSHPERSRLVEITYQDPKTVGAGLVRLREGGFIVDTGERKGVTKQVVVWRLTYPKTDTLRYPKTDTLKIPKNGYVSENGVLPFSRPGQPVLAVEHTQKRVSSLGVLLSSVPENKERKKESDSPPNRNPKPPPADHPDFVRFWSGYPRKTDKGHARKAWAAAMKKTTAEVVIQGLERHEFNPDAKYHPYPATWLNGEHWADEPNSVTPVSRKQAEHEAWGRF